MRCWSSLCSTSCLVFFQRHLTWLPLGSPRAECCALVGSQGTVERFVRTLDVCRRFQSVCLSRRRAGLWCSCIAVLATAMVWWTFCACFCSGHRCVCARHPSLHGNNSWRQKSMHCIACSCTCNPLYMLCIAFGFSASAGNSPLCPFVCQVACRSYTGPSWLLITAQGPLGLFPNQACCSRVLSSGGGCEFNCLCILD